MSTLGNRMRTASASQMGLADALEPSAAPSRARFRLGGPDWSSPATWSWVYFGASVAWLVFVGFAHRGLRIPKP